MAMFDWNDHGDNTISWTAFSSDISKCIPCEVTQGRQFMLVYDLYRTTCGPGLMANTLDAVNPEALKIFTELKELLLETRGFSDLGGLVGFTCTNAYPHIARSTGDNLPAMLKGMDFIVYQALQKLVGADRVRVTNALDKRPSTDNEGSGIFDPEIRKNYRRYAAWDHGYQDSDSDSGHEPVLWTEPDPAADQDASKTARKLVRYALVGREGVKAAPSSLYPEYFNIDHPQGNGPLPTHITAKGTDGQKLWARQLVRWLNYSPEDPRARATRELAFAYAADVSASVHFNSVFPVSAKLTTWVLLPRIVRGRGDHQSLWLFFCAGHYRQDQEDSGTLQEAQWAGGL